MEKFVDVLKLEVGKTKRQMRRDTALVTHLLSWLYFNFIGQETLNAT